MRARIPPWCVLFWPVTLHTNDRQASESSAPTTLPGNRVWPPPLDITRARSSPVASNPLSPLTPLPGSPLFPDSESPSESPLSSPQESLHRGKNARQNNSHGQRARKRHKHEEDGDYANESTRRHVANAMSHVQEFDVDAEDLPVNSSGFGGLRRSFVKDKRDADALCAQPGWRHLQYELGQGSIPLVDRKRRMIACIGGTPKDVERWTQEVVKPLEQAIAQGSRGVKFSKKEKHRKRGPFAATAIGVSHGGGEKVGLVTCSDYFC